MTRAGFEYILDKHVSTAGKEQSSIMKKRVTPHVLRHSCPMPILQATGDVRKVSLWLGHTSIQSTEIYLRADLLRNSMHSRWGYRRLSNGGKFKAPDKLLAMFKEAGKGGYYVKCKACVSAWQSRVGRRRLRIIMYAAYYRSVKS
jgi:integrase/recombinase XerD